jgi:hypothetical protein
MTQDEAIARIVEATTLSAEDVRDLINCRDDEFEALVEAYESLRGAGPETWKVILAILGVVGTVAGVVSGVAGATAAVAALRAL